MWDQALAMTQMNPNELKAAVAALRYTPQVAAQGPNASYVPLSYLSSFRWDWKEFLSSKEFVELAAATGSKTELLLNTIFAFDPWLCAKLKRVERTAAQEYLYLGARRLLQSVLGTGRTFQIFDVKRGSVSYSSDAESFKSTHSLVLEPFDGTAAEGLKKAKLTAGSCLHYPNVSMNVIPSDSSEVVELLVEISIGIPCQIPVQVMCEQVRRSSLIPYYSGDYL